MKRYPQSGIDVVRVVTHSRASTSYLVVAKGNVKEGPSVRFYDLSSPLEDGPGFDLVMETSVSYGNRIVCIDACYDEAFEGLQFLAVVREDTHGRHFVLELFATETLPFDTQIGSCGFPKSITSVRFGRSPQSGCVYVVVTLQDTMWYLSIGETEDKWDVGKADEVGRLQPHGDVYVLGVVDTFKSPNASTAPLSSVSEGGTFSANLVPSLPTTLEVCHLGKRITTLPHKSGAWSSCCIRIGDTPHSPLLLAAVDHSGTRISLDVVSVRANDTFPTWKRSNVLVGRQPVVTTAHIDSLDICYDRSALLVSSQNMLRMWNIPPMRHHNDDGDDAVIDVHDDAHVDPEQQHPQPQQPRGGLVSALTTAVYYGASKAAKAGRGAVSIVPFVKRFIDTGDTVFTLPQSHGCCVAHWARLYNGERGRHVVTLSEFMHVNVYSVVGGKINPMHEWKVNF